ncbi:hypothetical protein QJQ45_010944 [Haematococcus lacustris]|nr:hypothetical protein QJQ45_010944 [Haematococcus lacustris]
MVAVSSLFAASAADVTPLVPQHQACTRLRCRSGSACALLDVWQQLVQLMPAVQQVTCWTAAGTATEAMCESLLLMDEQPWARWLDIKVSAAVRPLPACCLDITKVFSNPSQPGRIKAVFGAQCQWLWLASSAGTSLEANLKHITLILATWDVVWEVYLDPKSARQRLRLERLFEKVAVGGWLEEEVTGVSMERHKRVKQLVILFGAAGIGTRVGWGADAVLRACCKVVGRPRGTDQLRGRVVLVDEFRTSRENDPWCEWRIGSAMNNLQGRSNADVSGVPVLAPPAVDEFVPATTLLDLPAALLDDIAHRLVKGRETLARICFGLFEAGLLHAPSFRLQLDRQCCGQLLSPRVIAAVRARECKLAITLELPRAQGSKLLAEVLGKLGTCIAVEACKLSSLEEPSLAPRTPLDCSRSLAQCLVDSFPALTSLSLHNYAIPCSDLVSLLSHPQLSLQLQQLDLSSSTILQPKRPEPGAATLDNLFHAARLKQLSLLINNMGGETTKSLLPNLQPLSQHLTQLCIQPPQRIAWGLDDFTAALQPLAQLQVLMISSLSHLGGLPKLLQGLPHLHTLQLPCAVVRGQKELTSLLAATQLTSIQLGSLYGLTSSCANVPCSWQRLELMGLIGCSSAAHLPLHSLTQPLVLGELEVEYDTDNCDLVAAAFHNLTQACKVPVRIGDLWLSTTSLTGGCELQQHVKLQQVVAELQALKHCKWGMVYVAGINVGAAHVATLAPLCQGCTHLEFLCGSVNPSLEFWRQLVQLMPTVTHLIFSGMKGSASTAMCNSLVSMADQPWARWLDICISRPPRIYRLPACWRAKPFSQPGKCRFWRRLVQLVATVTEVAFEHVEGSTSSAVCANSSV